MPDSLLRIHSTRAGRYSCRYRDTSDASYSEVHDNFTPRNRSYLQRGSKVL